MALYVQSRTSAIRSAFLSLLLLQSLAGRLSATMQYSFLMSFPGAHEISALHSLHANVEYHIIAHRSDMLLVCLPLAFTSAIRILHHYSCRCDLVCRQGQACQSLTAEPEEAAEAEHHVVKAARKEELSPRLTTQGQALLQASRAAMRAIQPTAASMREAYLHSLSLKYAPQSQ